MVGAAPARRSSGVFRVRWRAQCLQNIRTGAGFSVECRVTSPVRQWRRPKVRGFSPKTGRRAREANGSQESRGSSASRSKPAAPERSTGPGRLPAGSRRRSRNEASEEPCRPAPVLPAFAPHRLAVHRPHPVHFPLPADVGDARSIPGTVGTGGRPCGRRGDECGWKPGKHAGSHRPARRRPKRTARCAPFAGRAVKSAARSGRPAGAMPKTGWLFRPCRDRHCRRRHTAVRCRHAGCRMRRAGTPVPPG